MLKHAADQRTLGFVTFYFVLLVGQWLLEPSIWPVGLALILFTCWVSWVCAIVTHNTIHTPIFKSRRLNKLFQIVLTMSYGHPVSAYVPGHNLSHHRYTQQARDVMRTTKVRFRWNLLNGLLFLPAVGGAITRGDIKFFKEMRKKRPRWARQFIIEGTLFATVSIALLVLSWQKFLLYWFIPHLFAAWGIITINYLQHDGCDADDDFNHSRNFVGGLFNWLHFNNGYHGIHHMQPELHWSLLPQVHAEKLGPYIHPNLDQPSILLYAWRAFIWPGKRVSYDGSPLVLPPKMDDEPWLPDGVGSTSLGAET